ncbi:TonB-dependent receptor [Niabella terrae]
MQKTQPSIRFSIFCFFLIFSLQAHAQSTASVSGRVTSSDGQPAAGVSVFLEGRTRGVVAGTDGRYEIKNIPAGTYQLSTSFSGLENQSRQISLEPGQTLVVNFVLLEDSRQLEEVIIAARRNKNALTSTVAKMPIKNLENPQVYSSVPAALLKEQGITHFDDALRNVPGIARTWGSTGRGGDGGTYFALRGFEAQPGLVNGLPGLDSGNLDPAGIEEVQVIKGPSGTLFGASFYGYGGIINTITKKPYPDFGGELSYTIGSFDQHRLTADINAPLDGSRKLALRVNTALHTENSFQDAGFKKSFYIAPTLSYEVSDRLKLSLLAEILEEERAAPPILFMTDRETPLAFKTVEALNLNDELSFTNNDLTIRNPRKNFQLQGLYKLSEHWNSQTAVSGSNIKSDGIYTYLWGYEADQPSYYYQDFNIQGYNTNTFDIQQNFNGDFKLGNIRNRVLLGLDYFTRTVKDRSSGWVTTRRVNPQGEYITEDGFDGDGLDARQITEALKATEYADSKITSSAYSAYASDLINFTPKLSLMLGLRLDYFENKANEEIQNYDQLTFSPKLGVVYQPIIDQLSFFASYMNTFYNVAPSEIFDEEGNSQGIKAFEPERANQFELGTKLSLARDRFYATLSFYDTKVANRVYYTPFSAVQGGKTRSRGLELELNARPIPQLSLIAGFSHGKIEVIEGNEATPQDFYNEVGRSPGGQGPQTLANFWGSYTFNQGPLKHFGIGLGGNYAGVYRVVDNSATGVFDLPAYSLLSGSLFYNGDKFRVSLNGNNLTDARYYIGYWSINPQKPRNFSATLAYKF